jgi:hypothetical protein
MSQIRVARPLRDLGAAAYFYVDVVGFPVLASFDPDGSWLVLSPDAW